MVKSKTDNTKCCLGNGTQELSLFTGWNAKWNGHFGIQFGRFLKAKQSLTIILAVALLSIYLYK